LRKIFDCVAERLPELMGDRPLVKHFGAQHLHLHEDAPRVVWVPSEDTYASSVKPNSPDAPKNTPRALATNQSGVEVHLWGRTYEEAEELRDRVVTAVHRVAHGSYRLVRGRWDEAGETAESGIAYVLLLEMQVPVTLLPAEEIRKVTDYPITSKVVTP
jgi:hypothetical protein